MKHWSVQQGLVFLALLLSILAMLFFLSQSLYQNYKLDKQLASFQMKNNSIQKEITEMKDKVFYFQSKQYQDKYAKEVLNKLNPGEKVIVIQQEVEKGFMPESEFFLNDTVIEKTAFQEWKELFFNEEELSNRFLFTQ